MRLLTHVGKYQGEVVASNILGEDREAHYEAIPDVVYTDPQAASVGASEAPFSATTPLSEVAKTETYTRAYAKSNGFLTLLSDGERLTGAFALGPEAGEWLQQATLAIRARVPLDVLRDTIQPFPTFSEIYVATLKALRGTITAGRQSACRPRPGCTPATGDISGQPQSAESENGAGMARVLYTADATVTGGRANGHGRTNNGPWMCSSARRGDGRRGRRHNT